MKFRTCSRVPKSMSTRRETHTHTRTRTVSHMQPGNGSTLLKRRRSERRAVGPRARTLGASRVSAASGSSRARSQQVSARSPVDRRPVTVADALGGGSRRVETMMIRWRWRRCDGRRHEGKGTDDRRRLGRTWYPPSFGKFCSSSRDRHRRQIKKQNFFRLG